MVARFDEKALVSALETLSQKRRVAFAAACAEHLRPAYEVFSRRSGRGDSKALGDILGKLWDDLAGDSMSSGELQSALDDCMKLIPREDEGPWVPEQAVAEDAVAALAYALRCRQNGSSQEAALSARRCYEAVDYYVINAENVDLSVQGAESRALAHPLVQAELARQQRDIDDLSKSGDANDVAAARLRSRARLEGVSFSWGS